MTTDCQLTVFCVSNRRAFNNYVDRILPFFDPPLQDLIYRILPIMDKFKMNHQKSISTTTMFEFQYETL